MNNFKHLLETVLEEMKPFHYSDNLHLLLPEIVMNLEIYDKEPSVTFTQITKEVESQASGKHTEREIKKILKALVKKHTLYGTKRGGVEVFSTRFMEE